MISQVAGLSWLAVEWPYMFNHFYPPPPCMSQGYRLDTFWREADEITSYLRRATQLVGELICRIGGWELAWDNMVSQSGPVAVE